MFVGFKAELITSIAYNQKRVKIYLNEISVLIQL